MSATIVFADRFNDPPPLLGTVLSQSGHTLSVAAAWSPFVSGDPVYVAWAAGKLTTATATGATDPATGTITLSGGTLPANGTAVQIYAASVPDGSNSVFGATGGTRIAYPGRNADRSGNYTGLIAQAVDPSAWTGYSPPWWLDAAKMWSLPSQGGLLINPAANSGAGSSMKVTICSMCPSGFQTGGTRNNGPAVAAGIGARFQLGLMNKFPAIELALADAGGSWSYGGGLAAERFSVIFTPPNNGISCALTSNHVSGRLNSMPVPWDATGATSAYYTITVTLLCRDLDTDGTPWMEAWLEIDGVSRVPFCIAAGRFTNIANFKDKHPIAAINIDYETSLVTGTQLVVLNSLELFTGAIGDPNYDPATRDATAKVMTVIDNPGNTGSPTDTYGHNFVGGFWRTPVADFFQTWSESSDGGFTINRSAVYKCSNGFNGLHNAVTNLKDGGNQVWQQTGSGPYIVYSALGIWADPTGQNIIAVAEKWNVSDLVPSVVNSVSLVCRSSTDGGATWGAIVPISPTPESGYLYGDARGGITQLGDSIYMSCGYEASGAVAVAVFKFTPGAATNATPRSMVPTAIADWTDIAAANPYAGAKINLAKFATTHNGGIGPYVGIAEPTIGVINGKLHIAFRTNDFCGMSQGTDNGDGTWTWRDPFGSSSSLGLCDGQSGRPLIWQTGYGACLGGNGDVLYMIQGYAPGGYFSSNRATTYVWKSTDGVSWARDPVGPLFQGQEADYGFLQMHGGRLLYAQGRLDNHVRLFTSPRVVAAVADGDVRLGVDAGDGSTGTLKVPVPSQVQFGVQYDADDSKVGTFASNGVVLYSKPVAAEGDTFAITQGNDYSLTEATPLSWTDPGWWPDLSTATHVYFTCRDALDSQDLQMTCQVVPAGDNPQKVLAKPTHTDTDAMSLGAHTFDLQAEFADGGPLTIVQGTGSVTKPVRRT